MSMNLHLEVDGYAIDLWQTPSYVTHMCLSTTDFGVSWEMWNEDAKRAISTYSQWVKGTLNGVYESEEDCRMANAHVRKHLDFIAELVRTAKVVYVYAM